MMLEETGHPKIVARDEWLTERKALLAKEKAVTRHYDRVNAERRRLPMVRLDKEYLFDGPNGKVSLKDLFEGRKQLIVYHFMFGPDWEAGCPGCTGYVREIGDISPLTERNTTFALVSRAPLAKLEDYKASEGWKLPWYSSFGSDFNYDFHVSFEAGGAHPEYNYKLRTDPNADGEGPGISVFFRAGDDLFHTYSSFARGVERTTDSYALLDLTPFGRQEDWEDSPAGWPQKPTYG